jgi:hypothetical protein
MTKDYVATIALMTELSEVDGNIPRERGLFKLAAWPPLDRVGFIRRIRPSVTLLEPRP